MDKEYILLNNIGAGNDVSQRDLATITGLSLGTVNILLKKMVREGLVKFEKIPANRTVYILTPKGLQEKVDKTVYYVKHYYEFINSAKEKIKAELVKHADVSKVYMEITDRTLSDIALQVVESVGLTTTQRQKEADIVITDIQYNALNATRHINIAQVVSK